VPTDAHFLNGFKGFKKISGDVVALRLSVRLRRHKQTYYDTNERECDPTLHAHLYTPLVGPIGTHTQMDSLVSTPNHATTWRYWRGVPG
jgi:hypothetical protein